MIYWINSLILFNIKYEGSHTYKLAGHDGTKNTTFHLNRYKWKQ